MAESEDELAVLRVNTRAFILADPRSVVLQRSLPVDTGTGGTRPSAPVPQPAQTMRLIPTDASVGSTERRLPDGSVVTPTWVLLGEYNANMLRGDTFDLPDGSTGEVVYIQEKTSYQKKGEVVTRGSR